VATTFAIGAILIPALIKHGYPRGYAAALQATSGRARRDHPAVDPDDPVRRLGRGVDRRAVHRRHRPGPADRRRADAVRVTCMPLKGWGKNDGDGRLPVGTATRRRAGRC
jgi:C4-dicarboxylate transporter DctM subunit